MAKLAKSTLVSQSPHFRPQAIIHRQPLRTSQLLTCACHSGVTSVSTTTTALKGATPSSRGGASPGFRCRYLGASMCIDATLETSLLNGHASRGYVAKLWTLACYCIQ